MAAHTGKTIIVVDDKAARRDGMSRYCERNGLQVLKQHPDGNSGYNAIMQDRPALALVREHLPGLSGAELVHRLRVAGCETKVVIIGTSTDHETVRGMLAAGASAYFLQDDQARHFLHGLELVQQGDRRVSPQIKLPSDFDGTLLPHQTPNDPPLPPHTMVGRFQVEETLGRGGMGFVYRAKDTALERIVALKLLLPSYRFDPNRDRFLAEARALGSLHHPHIVMLHDIIHEGGVDGLVMEYVPGKPLSEHTLPLEVQAAVAIAIQAANALAAAEKVGVIHRDIKPANLMITPAGELKILDFGVAKLIAIEPLTEAQATQPITAPGTVLGTPEYMSPEQAAGKPVDHRTDIFSLGVVLYEILTAKKPHEISTIHQACQTDADLGRLPQDLLRAIARAVAPNPEKRYSTAAAFEADLQRVADSLLSA